MNILVTGANGIVARDLIKILLKKNHKIYGIYRTKNFIIKKICHKRLIWIKHDLIKKLKLKSKIDIIIHCAVVHNFSKKKKFSDFINTNVVALKNLIDHSKIFGIKLIINFSTVAIYGHIQEKKLNENYEPKNQDMLGLTKYLSEKILYLQPINFINLRLPGILCLKKNNHRPWLQILINKIKNNKNVIVYNANNYFNNVIDTKEIARLILKLIIKKKIIRDTFHLSASRPLKLIKIIKMIKSKYKSKSKIQNSNSIKKSFTISTNKIEKMLSYKPSSTKNIILRNL